MGHIIHNLYVTTRGPLQSQEDRSLTQALHSSGCHALEGVYPSFCQGLEGQRETPRIPKYRMPHPRMLDRVHLYSKWLNMSYLMNLVDCCCLQGPPNYSTAGASSSGYTALIPRQGSYVRAPPPYKLHKHGQMSTDPGSFSLSICTGSTQTREQAVHLCKTLEYRGRGLKEGGFSLQVTGKGS